MLGYSRDVGNAAIGGLLFGYPRLGTMSNRSEQRTSVDVKAQAYGQLTPWPPTIALTAAGGCPNPGP